MSLSIFTLRKKYIYHLQCGSVDLNTPTSISFLYFLAVYFMYVLKASLFSTLRYFLSEIFTAFDIPYYNDKRLVPEPI